MVSTKDLSGIIIIKFNKLSLYIICNYIIGSLTFQLDLSGAPLHEIFYIKKFLTPWYQSHLFPCFIQILTILILAKL